MNKTAITTVSRYSVSRARRRIFTTRVIQTFGMALYLYLLFMVYAYVLVPRRTFFAINTVSAEWSWVTLFLALVPILYLPQTFSTICDCVLWMIYAFVVAPTIMLVGPITGAVPYPLVFGLLLALALATIITRLRPIALPMLRLGENSFVGVVLIAWCVTNGFLLMRYGITLHLVSFENVYEVRDVFSDASTSLVIYVVNWTAYVVNVVLMVYSIRRKGRRYLLILVVASQLNIYGLTAYKSALVPLILIPLVLCVREGRWRWCFSKLGWVLSALLSFVTFIGFNYSPIVLGMVDRIFLAPASLTALYYKHFSEDPLAGPVYAGFRELYGLSGPIQTPADIIGRSSVFPRVIMANANLFADGYANFGWIGFVIIGVMLGLCLWLIKNAIRGLDLPMTIALFLVTILELLNGGLPTILVTNGLFFLIVFTLLLPRPTSVVG